MPQLGDSTDQLLHEGEEFVQQKASRFWNNFQEIALRDNVLEVAIGLILAAAFTTVVNSFISDILLPPISLLPFINKQLDEKFAVLRRGPNFDRGAYWGYHTLQQAIDDGAVVLAYGSFFDKVLNFLGVGVALLVLAQTYGWLASDSIIHPTLKCRFCRKRISVKAKRCFNCTSWQDGRELSQ